MPSISSLRTWYNRQKQPKWVRVLNWLVLFAFVLALFQSGPEFRAMVWHFRNGNTVNVNGVTFPLYFWYEPGQTHFWHASEPERKAVFVLDTPGPFRKGIDKISILEIESEPEPDPDQKLEKFAKEHEAEDGWKGMYRFSMEIRSEQMKCVEWFTNHGRETRCYGTAPVSSLFFWGDERAYDRFRRMMAQAR